MKKIRLIPILLALSLTGCLAGGNEDPKPSDDNTPNQNEPEQDEQNPGDNTNPDGGDTTPGDGGQTNPPDGGGDDNPSGNEDVISDYIDRVNLTEHSDFTTYENKTFLNDKISLVTLKSVIDGDSIHFYDSKETIKIRLVYVDTPESGEEYANEATQFVRNVLQEAKTIVITNAALSSKGFIYLDSTGQNNLGFVWYSSKENATIDQLRCLNLELVFEGFSQQHTSSSEDPLRASFLYCQSAAQSAKKNIWTNYVPHTNEYGYNHYNGYYGDLSWENSEDLIKKLHDIISKDVNALDYNWEINQKVDHSLYDLEMLDVVYSDTDIYYNKTNTYWQREHVFPASLMTGKLTSEATATPGRATDYHNLFAGESSGNSSRSNKNYGNASTAISTITDRGVENGGYAFDTKNFEPGNLDKGRLARSIFYMAVMYSETENDNYQPLKVVEDYVNYTAGNCQFAHGNKTALYEWCYNNVDLMEYQHNELVYSTKYNGVAQNNRNPFVDYPGLIEYAFGPKTNEAGDINHLMPSSLRLGLEEEGIHHYAIKTAKREGVLDETYTKNDVQVVGIDCNFNEVTLTDTSVYSVENVQLTKTGKQKIVIDTDINDIEFEIEVKQPEVNYSYTYTYSGTVKTDYGVNHIGSNGEGGTITSTLNGKQWTITTAKECDMRTNSNAAGAQFGYSNKPQIVTFESVNEFNNVDVMKFILNAKAGATMVVTIYIGNQKVTDFDVVGNSKENDVRIVQRSSPSTGKVKIVMDVSSPSDNYAVVRSIAINEKN